MVKSWFIRREAAAELAEKFDGLGPVAKEVQGVGFVVVEFGFRAVETQGIVVIGAER